MRDDAHISLKRTLRRTITQLQLVLTVVTALFAQEREPIIERNRPAWSLDLSSAGLAAEPNLYKSPRTISFVDSDTLVVTWFVSHQPQTQGAAAPATLKAVYIDAKTGKERSKSELEVLARPLKVVITPAGSLLVRTGQTLRLFSPQLNQLLRRDYSTPAVLGLTVSSDGARAIVCPASQDGTEAQVLNTDSLEVLETVPMSARCPNYILDNELKIATRGNSFSVMTIAHKSLLTVTLPKGRFWGKVITSHGSRYFGVLEERMRGPETLDMSFSSPDEFIVYRVADLKEVFRLKVAGISPWFPRRLVQDYAISPDGDLVAVMTNGVVRSYAVR